MARQLSAKARARLTRSVFATVLLCAALPVYASLQTLDEQTLSQIDAQNGVTITASNANPIRAINLIWTTDLGVANEEANTLIAPTLAGVSGNPWTIATQLDAGSPSVGGIPMLSLRTDWQPLLLTINAMTLKTPTVDYSAQSYGQTGIYSTGHLYLTNKNGIFNGLNNTGTLDFSSTGDVIYRQGAAGSPELSFGNFTLSTTFTNGAAGGQLASTGKIAITPQGLVIGAPYTNTKLLFDLMYDAAPTNFDTTGRSGIIKFGWQGGLKNVLMQLGSGGVGYGTYLNGGLTYYDFDGTHGGGVRSQGLNILAQWDFDSDFAWVLGQAGGNKTQAQFTNWRALGSAASPALSMPVTLDVLQNNVGPAGLCFGGGFASGSPVSASCTGATTPDGVAGLWVPSAVAAGKAAAAVMIRDGYLHAYNQEITVVDPTNIITPSSTYNWSLLYTFGKLDANIYLYPEGRAQGAPVTTTSTGLKADIALASQSPGYWDQANGSTAQRATLYTTGAGTKWATNTHFMIADTGVGEVGTHLHTTQYGVGLVNADLLWTANDLYFRVVNGDTGYPQIPGGLWMQTDTGATYRFRGLFGGGDLQNLSNPSGIFLLDVNLSTSRFIFALSPITPDVNGNAPIGFAGLLDLNSSSYLSLGEISSTAAFKISNMSGRIGWVNGQVNLMSGQNTADHLPVLDISNDLVFGSSATFGGAAGSPVIASVGFGSENFGRIVLPGGTWHSDISIKIPTN
jgi:hypothetical protein